MNGMDSILANSLRTVAVDFDGVIHDENPDPGYKMGKPMYYAKEAMQELRDNGFTVIIFTARVKTESDKKHVFDWLRFFEIPFDDIALTKPKALIYIDDHGYKFTGWPAFLKDATHIL